MKNINTLLVLSCVAMFSTAVMAAHTDKLNQVIIVPMDRNMYPYLNLQALQDIDSNSKTGGGLDAFIPIVSNDLNTKLFFSNIKLNGYTNQWFDGGAYLGYRSLQAETQNLYGLYASIDFKKLKDYNYLEQITLGAEYWHKRWFFNPKVFTPVGKKESIYEKALPGASLEIGYEFVPDSIVYLEGYYLRTFYTSNTPGVKIRLKQNLFSNYSKLSLLNQVDLEVSAQTDKVTKTRVSLGVNFKIGDSSKRSIDQGVARHMRDTISRSRDFIVTEKKPFIPITTSEQMTCGYDMVTGDITSGSFSNCPVKYSDIAQNTNMTVLNNFFSSVTKLRELTIKREYTQYVPNK